jgi:hypothetical protein
LYEEELLGFVDGEEFLDKLSNSSLNSYGGLLDGVGVCTVRYCGYLICNLLIIELYVRCIIPAELIQAGGEILHSKIHKLINSICV